MPNDHAGRVDVDGGGHPVHDTTSVLSRLTGVQRAQLKDFFGFYEIHFARLNEALITDLGTHPQWGPIIRGMAPEFMETQNRASLAFMRGALVEGEWQPLLNNMRSQGTRYAEMGFSFESWYEIVGAFRRHLVPLMVSNMMSEPTRLGELFLAMDCYVDVAMTVVGEQYVGAKERLIHQQQFYSRSLLEASIDALIAIDSSGFITDVNKEVQALTGCTRDELIGSRFSAHFTHPERATAVIAKAMKEQEVTDCELTALAVDGGKTEVSCNATPFYDRHRTLMGVFVAARDATERNRGKMEMEKAFRELEELKAATDEHAIVAMTDPKGKITYVNDNFCSISKYSREELCGQDHRIINSGFHSKEFIRNIWHTIRDGRVWKGEIKNKAKDGTLYWMNTTIVPYVDESGVPIQYIAIRSDITEQKRNEEVLREAIVELERMRSEDRKT